MAALSLSLPTAARWLRPSGAPDSLPRSNVGGLAQGPEEKRGLSGRVAGFSIVMVSILTDKRPSLGRGVPPSGLAAVLQRGKCRKPEICPNPTGPAPKTSPI